MGKKTRWITETAVTLALLVTLQWITKSLGQFVTGSCVNFVLSEAVLFAGLGCGIAAAVFSPFFAFLLGIGPAYLPITFGISLGNTVLVCILWLFFRDRDKAAGILHKICAIGCAAAAKFLVLSVTVTKLILPALGLAEKQAAAIGASFSWPQLITALAGSALAVVIRPRLHRAS